MLFAPWRSSTVCPICVQFTCAPGSRDPWSRTSPTVSRGCPQCPRTTSVWCRLLQATPIHPCPQSYPRPRWRGRTKLPRADCPFVFSRTPRACRQDRRLAQVLARRESHLLWIYFQVFAQIKATPQVCDDRTWRLRRRKRECRQASPERELWLVLCFLCTPKLILPSSPMSAYPLQDRGQSTNKTVLKLMQDLREGGRVEVNIKPVCIFLFRDGGRFCSVTPRSLTQLPTQIQALSSPSTPTTTSSSLSLSDGG